MQSQLQNHTSNITHSQGVSECDPAYLIGATSVVGNKYAEGLFSTSLLKTVTMAIATALLAFGRSVVENAQLKTTSKAENASVAYNKKAKYISPILYVDIAVNSSNNPNHTRDTYVPSPFESLARMPIVHQRKQDHGEIWRSCEQ